MTDPAAPTPQPPESPTPPKPKRKRRWLRVLVVFVVLLLVGGVLLVALLPTIASTSLVRSMVLSQAKPFVPNGRVEIADWSFGWFSPIRVQGFKLYDDHDAVVLEADEVKTDLTLARLVRQNFDLGDTTVDAAGHVKIYADGSNNLQRIFEPKHAADHKPATAKPAASGESKLPDVRGTVTLKLHGDAELLDASDAVAATARLLPGSGGTIHIANINQPIDADFKLLYDTGESTKAGTVTLKSSVDAVQNNAIDLAGLSGSIDLTLADVDVAAAKPILALAGRPDVRLAGVAGGRIAGELKPGEAGGVQGTISVTDLEVAAAPLKETYKAARMDVPVKLSRQVVNGVSRLTLDTGVTLPEATVRVTGDLPEPALAKLADKQMPGDTGMLGVSVNADAAKLVAALPNTLRVLPDVKVEKGGVTAAVALTLAPDAVQSHVKTDLTLAGTKAGRPIAVEPVTLTADATLTRLDDPVAGLRKLAASFTSAFATFQGGGDTLARLNGHGEADLGKAQQQAAQFIDLGGLKLAGTGKLDVESKTPADDASRLLATLTAGGTGLHVTLPGRPPIDLATASVRANADLAVDPKSYVPQSARSVSADVLAGDSADKPLVTVAVGATNVDWRAKKLGTLSVTRCAVPSFPRLQAMLDPFVPALREQKLELAEGSMGATVEAKDVDWSAMTGTVTSVDAKLPALKIRRDGRDVFQDDVTFTLAAVAGRQGEAMTVDVSRLSLASSLATLKKADGPLAVTVHGGLPRGSGAVVVGLDAVKANALARAFAAADSKLPQVTAGRFDGTLTLASEAGKDATAGLAGALAGLTLADTPVSNETYTLDLNAVVPPAFDRVQAGVRVRGEGVSVIGKDIRVLKPADGVPPQKLIEHASFEVGVKDLAKANAIMSALVPGVKLPVSPAGGVLVTAAIDRGKADVDLAASKLVVTNPAGRSFAFDADKPVSLKLAATLQGDKTLSGVRIDTLGGDFDVAQVKLAEPIVVALGDTMTASGKLNLTAGLDRLLALLAVVQQADRPMPYRGTLDMTQTIAPRGNAITLVGAGTVRDFAVLDDAGQPTVREPQVKIANDLAADLTDQVATINSMTIDMASSNAAKVAVTGGVEKWSDERRLKNVVVHVDAVGEQAWPILYGLMPAAQREQLKDAKLTGPIKIDVTANGAYPAKPTWNESLRSVVAYGGVTMKGLNALGLDVSDFALPFSLVDDGKFVTGDTRKKGAARFAKPFTVNGGQGDLGSMVIDLGNPALPLSIGRNQKIFQKVQINPVMTAQLGTLASLLFKDADSATGRLDLVAQDCQNVPLTDFMNKRGTATFVYSLHELSLTGFVPSGLARLMDWGSDGIVGDIDEATVALKNGIAQQDMTVVVNGNDAAGKSKKRGGAADEKDLPRTMTFKGGINLVSNSFKDYKVSLSTGLLRPDWRDTFPDGATVSLSGKVDDFKNVAIQAFTELGSKVLIRKGVDKLGGDKGIGDILKKLEKR